jgi:hypothetical protein
LTLRVGRLIVLVLPCFLLLAATFRAPDAPNAMLWLGSLFQVLGCLLALAGGQAWRGPNGPAVIMLYVIGLSWLLLGSPPGRDWFFHLAQSVMLVVPLAFFAMQCLRESGAPALRHARLLADRLSRRRTWPADLDGCRLLPEVKALREALHFDASPALALLADKRPQVRVAALAALEFRPEWRAGQPEAVLQAARNAREPEVRAAAVSALANLRDRVLIDGLAEFLRDPSSRVRQAAVEALLWNPEERWHWVRQEIRKALGDAVGQDDGPLRTEGQVLPRDAIADLTAWSAEKGLLAQRAVQTLGDHYSRALAAAADPELPDELRRQLADVHAPAMLRLELARLLHEHHELDEHLIFQLIDPAAPAPLRLIGVEAMLAAGDSVEATSALRDLAKLPNREIALATAAVVQRRLGVELGLPRGAAPPDVHSRQAAEVSRRLMQWACHQEIHDVAPPPPAEPVEELDWRSMSEM